MLLSPAAFRWRWNGLAQPEECLNNSTTSTLLLLLLLLLLQLLNSSYLLLLLIRRVRILRLPPAGIQRHSLAQLEEGCTTSTTSTLLPLLLLLLPLLLQLQLLQLLQLRLATFIAPPAPTCGCPPSRYG